jgi:gliding motility-associated-like protein
MLRLAHYYRNQTSGKIGVAFLWCWFVLCQYPNFANAQLTVTPSSNANTLANQLSGTGVRITNPVLNCPSVSAGLYSGTNSFGLGNGVVLTTGLAQTTSTFLFTDYGANGVPGDLASYDNGGSTNDPNLRSLLSGNYTILNQCILEFDMEADGNFIEFRYAFGSEEYPEYVCSEYTDVFGFFITGPNPLGGNFNQKNIALIPNTNLPVAINSINPGSPGSFGSGNCTDVNESLAYASFYRTNNGSTETYDGFTVVLTARENVIPCQSYHMKLAIGDAGDDALDSGVFLEGSSFSTNTPPTNTSDQICNGDTSLWSMPNYTVTSVSPNSNYTTVNSSTLNFFPTSTTQYTIVTTNLCGTNDTFIHNINVLPNPIVDFQFSTQNTFIDSIVFITNNSSNYSSITVLLDGQPQNPIPSQLTFSQPGTYCLFATATNALNCTDTATYCITVVDDTCWVNVTVNQLPGICRGDSAYLSVTGVGAFSVVPANQVFVIDTNHAWLYPDSSTTYLIITNDRCGQPDTLLRSLVVNQPIFTYLFDTLCGNDSLVFNGSAIYNSGIYYDTLANVFGCDSFVILNFTKYPTETTNIYQTICIGSTYFFNGVSLSGPGLYFDTLETIHGCDSFLILDLSVISSFTTNLNVSICNGDSYLFNGNTLTTAGTYLDTLGSVAGCDSFIVLQLDIINPQFTNITDSFCVGGSYFFNGNSINMPGVYYDTLQAVNSCDSFITITLSHKVVPQHYQSVGICPGEVINFFGQQITTPGNYSQTVSNNIGCDSVINLNVYFHTVPSASFYTDPAGDSLLPGEIAIINTSQNADTLFWNINGSPIDLNDNNTVLLEATGNYCIDLNAISENGCSDSFEICFFVIPGAFKIPNAFSPNKDGKNDLFYPVFLNNRPLEVVAFRVYNRWGEILHDNPLKGWDGTYSGQPQPLEVYTYFMHITIPDLASPEGKQDIQRMGSFSLLR